MSCRFKASLRTVVDRARHLLTDPLDPQWTIAVTAALGALLLGGVGILLIELHQVSENDRRTALLDEQTDAHVGRLVETDRGWEFEVEGPAGARVLVVDQSGQSLEIVLDDLGLARSPAAGFSEATVWIEGPSLPATPATLTPIPEPTPLQETAIPTPAPIEDLGRPAIAAAPTAVPEPTPLQPTVLPTPAPTAINTPGVRVAVAPTLPIPTSTPRVVRPTSTVTPPVSPTTEDPKNEAPVPPILHLVTDSGPRLAITFDGGASSNRTAELLDLLQDLDIRATLFLTGGFIRTQPALVRRAVLAGHEVGNHTDSHLHLTSYASDRRHTTLPDVTRERLLAELSRTEEAFHRATGRQMAALWRAPYGEENATLRRWAFEAGYLHVRWSSLEGRSLDTMDWIEDEHSPYFRDSRRIMDRLLRFPRLRGGIILMHLATDREEAPWTHLPEFVAALRDRSIEPVKVTTLLSESRIWRGWLERAAQRHSALWDSPPEPSR